MVQGSAVIPSWCVIVLAVVMVARCRQPEKRDVPAETRGAGASLRDDGLRPSLGEEGTRVAAAGGAPRLDLPLACAKTGCVVRNFVDAEPGPGAKDHACGALTYDGHDGTDILAPSYEVMASGVDVVAAAGGTVLRVRDEILDASIHGGGGSVQGREAGNAVVIGHGNGWETQYSHLRRGSVCVRPGDVVAPGGKLGVAGLSGHTEFLHLHFEVRKDGAPVDPYTGLAPGAGCGAGTPLWTDGALRALAYRPVALMHAGFVAGVPDPRLIRSGETGPSPQKDAGALVFMVDMVGRREGDLEKVSLLAPDGSVLAVKEGVVEDPRVQWFVYVGKKRPAEGWPSGTYVGTYTLLRGEEGGLAAVLQVTRKVEL